MDKTEEPKVHCIVLDKPPCDLIKGDKKWKLCKVFSTLAKSKERIQREKNATRKYKPRLVFTVSNPSDTDRQTLNLNKGVVKDHLGFAVNGDAMVALISGVLEKGSQWVLTTNEHLKYFSAQDDLTVDTFYDNEFDAASLQEQLPSLFNLETTSKRTEVVLASPILKHQVAKDRSMQKGPRSGLGKQGKERKKNESILQKVVLGKTPTKSESDLKGEDYSCAAPQGVKESFSGNDRETKPNYNLKRDPSAKEQHTCTIPAIIPRIKEEPPKYDYKPIQQYAAPTLMMKVKEEVIDNDFESNPKSLGKQGKERKKNESILQKVVLGKTPTKTKSDLKGKDYSCAAPQGVKESFFGDDRETKPNYNLKRDPSAKEQHTCTIPAIIPRIKAEPPEYDYKPIQQDAAPTLMIKVKEEVIDNDFESNPKSDRTPENLGILSQTVITKVKEEINEYDQRKICNNTKSDKQIYKGSQGESQQTNISAIKESISKHPHQSKSRSNEYQKHSTDIGASEIPTIEKEVLSCDKMGKLQKDVNAKHSVKAGHQSTSRKTVTNEKGKVLENCQEAKPKVLKKNPGSKYCRSLKEGGQVSEQPLVFLAAKTSKTKERKGSLPKPKTERDSCKDQSLLSEYATEGKGFDTKSDNVLEILQKSGPRTFASDRLLEGCVRETESRSNQDIEHEQSLIADPPSSKVSRPKTKSNFKTTLQVVVEKLDIDVAKQHSHLTRGEPIERHPETERELEGSSEKIEKTEKQTLLSATNDDGAKILHLPLKKRKSDHMKDQCADIIKKRKTTLKNPDSKSKQFPSDEQQTKPKPKMCKSPSFGSEESKTCRHLANESSRANQPAGSKPTSKTMQTEEGDTSKKGILKIVPSTNSKPNKDGNSTGKKKRIRFSEYKTASKDQTLPKSATSPMYEANPPRAGFDLIGPLNTQESFLLNVESKKEQIRNSKLLKAVAHHGSDRNMNPHEAPSSDPTTTGTLSSNLKRRAVTLETESDKIKRTENHANESRSEISSSMQKQCELKGDKVAADKAPSDSNTSFAKQYQVRQKNIAKARRDVTLLVGDSTLQHIQPKKFFRNKRVCVKTVPGARVDNISDYITKFVQQENPSEVILHIGTNDLQKGIQYIAGHIESVGKLVTETLHGVSKFTISSITERREDITGEKYVKASEVNRTLRNLQLEHGWGYIDNGNIDTEVHVGPDGIHLNAIGIEAFAANIGKHMGLAESISALRCDCSLPSSKDQTAAAITPKDANSSVASPTKSYKEILSSRQDQPDDIPSEYSECRASPSSKMSRGESTSCETKGVEEKFALLIGDSMLEPILPHRLSRIKQTKLVVVPNAKVDTIGDIISTHVRNPSCDEVILHVGSNDLKDGVYEPSVIASNIETIGLNLQKTFPSIAAFTISGIIRTYQFKYSDSTELNSQLKSLTSKHGWAYICNDNICPEFNLKRRDPKLNQCGTRLFASNILDHLRSEKRSSHCSTSSQHSMAKKSTDAEHVNNPKTEKRPFVERTHHPDQEHEQSGRYPGKRFKPYRRISDRGFRKTERGRSYPQDTRPSMGDDVLTEKPNFRRAWSSGAYNRERSGFNSGRQRGARHETPPRPRDDQTVLFPKYSGCYVCGGLDHKKADCPRT